jgi:predicted esterase
VIYIGSHANLNEVPNSTIQTEDGATFALHYRLFEYVESDQVPLPELKDSFLNHMQYFTDELIPKVEREFNQDTGKQGRIFYGYSNGAGFGANLLNKDPNLIGTYICYSTLGSKADKGTWSTDIDYPDLYLQYGDQEADAFKSEAEFLKAKYQESNSFCELKVYQGGHDETKWLEEFKMTISEILKVK